MVLPPAVPGDEFDFENMTPEEQLAWLESLAKRQGASEDELTTAADLDVPIPEDVEVDEPGYVPYSILHDGPVPVTEAATRLQDEMDWDQSEQALGDEADDAVDLGEALGVAGPDEAEARDALAEEGQQDTAVSAAADPMRWLGDLAVQSDEDTVVHVRADDDAGFSWSEPDEEAVSEPTMTFVERDFEDDESGDDQSADISVFADHEAALPVDHGPQDDEAGDFLDGVDPMLWLESLAARQGAKTEELLTAADLAIDQPPEDIVIDEPGYVPFEAGRMTLGRGRWSLADDMRDLGLDDLDAESEAAAERDSALWDELLEAPDGALEMRESAAGDEEIGPLVASDAMTWLESPEHSPEGEQAEAALFSLSESADAGPDEGALSADGEREADSLLWLEDLATEPDSGLSEYLAVDEADTRAIQRSSSPEAGSLAGMTDDEIELALERGELSGEQELAWLKLQASRLAAEREADAASEFGGLVAAEPASPGTDLPRWIADMHPVEDDIAEIEAASLLEPEADEPELSGWLTEMTDDVQAGEFVEPEVGQAAPDAELEAAAAGLSEAENVLLDGGSAFPELDMLREAVDEAFPGERAEPDFDEMEIAPDAGVESPGADFAVAEAEAGDEEAESVLRQAIPVEMPAWLLDEEETSAFQEADVPAWLRDMADRESPSADDRAWLEAREAEAGADWPRTFDGLVADELRWETAQPPDAAPPTRERGAGLRSGRAFFPPPDAAQLADYRQRVTDDPDDHASRIALARALWAIDEVSDSVAQYEALIDAGQYLPDVVNDLSAFVEDHPAEPQIHRMLGDAYLRRGRLKEALYSYRRALEQL